MEGWFVIGLYGLGGLAILVLGLIFYSRSMAHRKVYCCPNCGERFRVEWMTATRCNVCGTPLPCEMMKGGGHES